MHTQGKRKGKFLNSWKSKRRKLMRTALEGSPSGDAGQPRELALSGDQGTTANPKKRNTKSGIRSIRK